jgi:hypothetical protein
MGLFHTKPTSREIAQATTIADARELHETTAAAKAARRRIIA